MNLPIDTVLPELTRRLAEHPTLVLQAPPGAGKTTRVPLALLAEPWMKGHKLLMLEPRRLAARSAAHFMAAQLIDGQHKEAVGKTVGYRTRMDSRVGPQTRIEVVTEGILTRMLQRDPALEGYAAVVFDEFHERSLQADLGLALVREVQQALRSELRILVMSATLDGSRVAACLDNAPMIISEGRSWPVTVSYRPVPPRQDWLEHLVAQLLSIADQPEQGSLLVFLPGVAEIRRVQQRLEGRLPADLTVTPLYGDLSAAAQDQAMAPSSTGQRKLVLATAIAETSITIEGISTVVDAGFDRRPRFDPVSGLTRLDTVRVSRAGADQRQGRAGRLGPGRCYRLWPESERLAEFALPKILDADLGPVVLELAQWGCGDPSTMVWLDPP
ncbi:MAG: ATP-dependent helicase HrpB, partial [Gammaproteobacteria bacterium HGW-Gammaproteobacteria-14]